MVRRTITTVQHGLGTGVSSQRQDGELVTGPETCTDAVLATNRSDFRGDVSHTSSG